MFFLLLQHLKNYVMMKKIGFGSNTNCREHVFVKDNNGFKRICIHNIVFLEAKRSCCIIHLQNCEMKVNVPLCEVLDDLDPHLFLRIHRSYSVNQEHLLELSKYKAIIDNGQILRVGKVYYQKILKGTILIG